ncbi:MULTISPECIES: TadG family pilus assembly protein [unclassified Burkholderia]|uniref:TadG family pilus assembly protein n=1 Tax=unclassified Burkholderia TaxID=2613784 RepID=UPI000F5B4E38|nr:MULTISPECIES: TadG family pilus assembly protein [unclassified Burkholderia]RQR95050.1 pilus assembly protein TadE [Burkholderia sp. Bp8994]RQS20045.1 pilus assembly protein TadE [Burkholderia sp. Bp8995]RQS33080.1 pilus assembly protein TadE [Burkholderia sp. Bp8990]RQS39879.1 pilus assembly protein TadE [Burkholderia sp. Bp8989]RQS62096.1 pilus assembly protein TadE [Burkholderia sp. Bp8984]
MNDAAGTPCIGATRERGSVALFFLLFLIPLLSFGALAIDIAWVATVRNQLQNAADAAALAAADAMMSPTGGALNWSQAAPAANGVIAQNAAAGAPLATGTVTTGYWNVTRNPASMQPTTITPGQYDVPAVQVTVSRAPGVNGGSIPLLLGGLLGIPGASGSATAIAVLAAPGGVAAGGLFPIAIDQCVYNQYWNTLTNQPLINPLTNQPYEFSITNGQTYGTLCMGGQWTSFLSTATDTTTMGGLMVTGNPTTLNIGDSIYLATGVKATLYTSVPVGSTVVLPVVTQTASSTYVPIVAFAAFRIDVSLGGTYKYIQGHFVGGVKLTGVATGVGPYYGVYVPPRLAL